MPAILVHMVKNMQFLPRIKFASFLVGALVVGEGAMASSVVLLPGQTAIVLSGQISGPVRDGGPGDYVLFDEFENEYRGNAILQSPIAGQYYKISIDALTVSGEISSLIIDFPAIQFTGSQSFEGGILLSQYAQGGWDLSDGLGRVAVYYGNAYLQATPVPEPQSIYLLVIGLLAITWNLKRKRAV